MKTAREKLDDPLSPAIISTPDFPIRAGVAAEGTAILIFVAMLCIFQYWLLTATLEAYHAGDGTLPLGAFFASFACFLFAAGLTIAGEIALLRQQDYLRKSRSTKAPRSTILTERTAPPPPLVGPSSAARVHDSGSTAGGGDAG